MKNLIRQSYLIIIAVFTFISSCTFNSTVFAAEIYTESFLTMIGAYASMAAYINDDVSGDGVVGLKGISKYQVLPFGAMSMERQSASVFFLPSQSQNLYIITFKGTHFPSLDNVPAYGITPYLDDLVADIKSMSEYYPGRPEYGYVQEGHMRMATEALMIKATSGEKLIDALKRDSNSAILIVGHSLGGGAATAFGCLLSNAQGISSSRLHTITFGASPSIDKTLAANLGYKINLLRVVANGDPVPFLSASSLSSHPAEQFGRVIYTDWVPKKIIEFEAHKMPNYLNWAERQFALSSSGNPPQVSSKNSSTSNSIDQNGPLGFGRYSINKSISRYRGNVVMSLNQIEFRDDGRTFINITIENKSNKDVNFAVYKNMFLVNSKNELLEADSFGSDQFILPAQTSKKGNIRFDCAPERGQYRFKAKMWIMDPSFDDNDFTISFNL